MLLWETLCVWTLSISQTSLGWCMNLSKCRGSWSAARADGPPIQNTSQAPSKTFTYKKSNQNSLRASNSRNTEEKLLHFWWNWSKLGPSQNWRACPNTFRKYFKKTQSLSSIGAFLKGDWPADCHEHAISKAGISWQTQTRWFLCVLKPCGGETWFDLCMFQSVLPAEPSFRSDNPRDKNWKCCGPVLSPNVKSIAFFVVTAGWLLVDYRDFTYMELQRQSGR